MIVAFAIKRIFMRGDYHPLMLELPAYKWPERAQSGAGPVGARADLPAARGRDHFVADGAAVVPVELPGAAAGRDGPGHRLQLCRPIGQALQYVFAPIGFNWQICVALVPGLAAREVAVGAFGTVYSHVRGRHKLAGALQPIIAAAGRWPRVVAARLVRVCAAMPLDARRGQRETNTWRYPP